MKTPLVPTPIEPDGPTELGRLVLRIANELNCSDVDIVTRATSFAAMDYDQLDCFELLMGIEESMGVELDEAIGDDRFVMATVGELIDWVSQLKQEDRHEDYAASAAGGI